TKAFPELRRSDLERVVHHFFDSMADSLGSGHTIALRGLGSFTQRERKPRIGRNPKNGTVVEVPGKRVAMFKMSRQLLVRMNEEQSKP
ncbi:MAG: HU family DNA-binding protein, partial [Pseudomonadota bacterium]